MDLSEKLLQHKKDFDDVKEAGKKSEYDRFWDSYQQNGNRRNYSSAFGIGWNADTFKPKHPLIVTNAVMMFYSFNSDGSEPVEFFKDGIELISLDTSKCTAFSQMCSGSKISSLGTIDFSGGSDGGRYAFASASDLVTINKLILKNVKYNATSTYQNTFQSCANLVNINAIEGKICNNNFDTHWSTKLSKQSIINIVNALLDTATGLAVTFSKTAVNTAFGINVDDETTFPEGSEWYTLRNSRSNWTFNYA